MPRKYPSIAPKIVGAPVSAVSNVAFTLCIPPATSGTDDASIIMAHNAIKIVLFFAFMLVLYNITGFFARNSRLFCNKSAKNA